LGGNEIGIKLADGSFYPIIEEDFTGRKRLVVTTARDNQDSVQIDLFRGSGERADQANYLGSLMIENIRPAPKKEPEIELQLGLDPDGTLEAVASDPVTGEKQSISVNLSSLRGAETPAEELEEMEAETQAARPEVKSAVYEEPTLAGESYPIGATDRRKTRREPRKPGALAVVGFVILGLVVVAGAAYLAWKLVDGARIPRLFGGTVQKLESVGQPEPSPEEAPSVAAAQPSAGAPSALPAEPAAKAEPGAPAEPGAQAQPAAAKPAARAQPPAERVAEPASAEGIWYRIVWGDTLWDLAGTYYRNPWLYPRLAKANKIANPDLIIAGHRLFIPKK
jgi:nucleoid-associated protein YgaU